MFLGHYGLAFAAKKLAPRTSLGTLALAAQLADEVWPILVLLGIEQVRIRPEMQPTLVLDFVHYPISHSLATQLVAGLVFGLIYFAVRKDKRGAWVAGALVPSHWVLDLLVHEPDLPIWPGGPKVGLGLWRSMAGTFVAEALLFGGGFAVYLRATKARDGIGRFGAWGFAAVLGLLYIASMAGPPPASVPGVAYSALILWLFAALAYWVDSHRVARTDGT